MKEEKIRDILLKYQRKRDDNEEKLEKRKQSIYESLPEIKKIDDEISMSGLRLTKAVLKDTKKSSMNVSVKWKNLLIEKNRF